MNMIYSKYTNIEKIERETVVQRWCKTKDGWLGLAQMGKEAVECTLKNAATRSLTPVCMG